METKLNQLLADFVVEYHKLQTFHWYVKGKDFFTVHAKLEEYYDHVNENIDEVAEHILMLNMKPLASLQEFLKVSSITEAHGEFVCSQDILIEVLKDFEYLLNEVKELKKYADDQEQYVISALMDNYISHYTKAVWMLKQQSV